MLNERGNILVLENRPAELRGRLSVEEGGLDEALLAFLSNEEQHVCRKGFVFGNKNNVTGLEAFSLDSLEFVIFPYLLFLVVFLLVVPVPVKVILPISNQLKGEDNNKGNGLRDGIHRLYRLQ